MATAAPPPAAKKPSPPPPAAPPPSNGKPAAVVRKLGVTSQGVVTKPLRVVIFGGGGTGKSELASHLGKVGQKMLFIDLEQGSSFLDVTRIDDVQNFEELRGILHDQDLMNQFDGVVIDSLTKAEELASDWVIRNVKHEKAKPISGIEDYGFGKGYTHIYEALLQLLGDFDSLTRRGKHVVCIAHNCIVTPENPDGENFAKEQPRLQTTKDGKNSFRYKVLEWTDHLFCIRYDVAVIDGKGTGSGTRAIYCQEMPHYWAKSRTLSQPVVYQRGSALLWEQLFAKGE